MATSTPNTNLHNTPASAISFVQAFANISATALDLPDLLASGLDMVKKTIPCDMLSVLLVSDETDALILEADKGQISFAQVDNLMAVASEASEVGHVVKTEDLPTNISKPSHLNLITIPLTIERLVIGVIVAGTQTQFTALEEQLLTIFSSQLTVAIANTRLHQRISEQRQRELIRSQIASHLQELSTIINATLDLDRVLSLILQHIGQIVPYHQALVLLLDGQNLVVQAIANHANPPDSTPDISVGTTIFPGPGGIYYQALTQQYPSAVRDISQSSGWLPMMHPEMTNTSAWIGAPLIIRGQVMGLLSLHHREIGYFDQADLNVIHTIANQAAIAIDNAQIYYREQHKATQFQIVAQIGRQATEIHEVQPLLDMVVERLNQDLGYDYVTIFLYRPHRDSLQLRAANDLTADEIAEADHILLLDGDGVISTASRSREPIVVNDVSSFDGYFSPPNRSAVKSELAIPLTTKGQLIGLLDIQSAQIQAFLPDDLILAQTVADQLAVAIANANLFEEKDQRMAELIAFNEIGGMITDPVNLDHSLMRILQKIKALYQVEVIGLLTLSDDMLRYKKTFGLPENVTSAVQANEGFAGKVVQEVRPLRITDVSTNDQYQQMAETSIYAEVNSLLAVPIQVQDRVLGVIEMVNPLGGHVFTRTDEVILSFIATTIAVAMDNSHLFRELAQKVGQLAGLFEASQSLSSLDLVDVLRTTAKQVVNLLESESATVYLLDDKEITAVPGASFSNKKVQPAQRVFLLDEGTVGWVLKHRKPLRIDDVQQDTRMSSKSDHIADVKSVLTVPLIGVGNFIGVLETINKRASQGFSEEDEILMTAFASQAAIAIFNAKLYQNVLERENFVASLRDTGTSISETLNIDDILNVICWNGLRLFDVDMVSIWRHEDKALKCLAAKGKGFEALTELHIPLETKDHFLSQIFSSGQPHYRNNTPNDLATLLDLAAYPDAPNIMDNVAMLGIPLRKAATVMGVLLLIKTIDTDYFTDEVQTKATIFGNQITGAIENALLHQETTIRLAEVSTLYTLAHQMSTNLDIEHLLESTINVIRMVLDSLGCGIFLLEADGLVLAAQNGKISTQSQGFLLSAAQKTVDASSPIYLKNATDLSELGIGFIPDDIESLLMVPLVAHGKLLGTLAVYDKSAYAFGDDEGRLLTIVAVQVASALENSKLFNDLQQHAKNVEETLSELQEFTQLQTEFVQNVSHELRTPLTFIKAYVDLVLEGELGPITEGTHNSLEIVSHRTDDLTRLVSDLVTDQQLRMVGLEVSTIDLSKIISIAVQSAVPAAQKSDLQIIAHIPESLPKIEADASRINQVFDNLIGNAMKFTTQGGKIIVSAKNAANYVTIAVKDTGVGMSKAELSKIFNRFYQVSGPLSSSARRKKGTGLGLTIVKQIVEAHHGHISVKSRPGQGTEFIFTLPIQQPKFPIAQ